MTDTALLNASVSELRQHLRDRTVSSEELTRAYLSNIERRNPALNAVVTVCSEHALESARQADAALGKGEHGLLTGVPLLHKEK
jgi:aspartyl-tRNA(Asn)/glutamyl-tRNA(Gln) amidotransferase subunit A